ncbi:MAG: MBL fold metallo-hydrolase [Erysipelotrichaceae bacterium]|nr:MBL fold metallo-hydrolase [Erysipelotrichaceae bacterium]
MKYWIIASGSKGNCTVIESNGQFLIVDCGGSKKHIQHCLEQIGVTDDKITAVLITHEHSDHIKQISMFSHFRVYAPFEIKSLADEFLVEPLMPFETGCFRVMPLPLSHDVLTVGYVIDDGREKTVVLTDSGYVSHQCEELIMDADYYVFESNHDTEMLMKSHRPPYLKQRIVSDNGHMSNEYASRMLSRIIGSHTKEIVLAHLSQECNTPEKALETLRDTFESCNIDPGQYRIHAAEQFELYEGGR